MIRMRAATMLAFTKLRTRKVRLIVTIVISGLLFSVLAGASIAARGVFASITDFSSEGFSDRYLVQAGQLSSSNVYANDTVIDRAIAIHKDTIARKKAEAKRLDIEYNAESESPPFQSYPGPNGNDFRTLAENHPAAQQAVAEYNKNQPKDVGLADLKKQAASYNVSSFYESRTIPYDTSGGRLQVLVGDKETYDDATGNKNFSGGPQEGLETFASSWTLMSSSLLKPFILPGQQLTVGEDGSIPIIVPVSAAQELLGMKSLPKTAKAGERLERTRELREAAKSIAFNVCYRNSTSMDLIQKALSAQKEIEQNKNKKDYRKPDLQYGLPTTACTTAPVVRDVRTKDQKASDAKQLQFEQLFGEQPAVESSVRFRVVGLVPDADYSMAMNATQIIKSLVTSTLGSGWYAPLEAAQQNPTVKGLFFKEATANTAPRGYYAEFKTAAAARSFIDNENCEPDYNNYDPSSLQNPAQKCLDAGKPFGVTAYGSNSLGLESAQRGFNKIFSLVGVGIAVIASLIMMGTVGKMIADSRRETAVFRAIGAKKLDIAQIYILYTIFLSVLITIFALLVGLLAALWANAQWSAEVTQQALLAYNAQDLDKSFKLYALHLPDMLYLLAVAVGAGLLSAVFPLIRSLRRNPIRDMRDDT